MRIAMVGTRGVPARYGGFETCVEEVGRRLADRGHDVVVYCRTGVAGAPAAGDLPTEHLGMRLVHLPAVRRKVLETLSHTALSVGHLSAHRVDAALVFNAANAPLLPALRARGIPVATHVDGLEWRRAKWGDGGRRYYRNAEAMAVRWSDALIADAQGIADYYRAEFDADTELIAYGAPRLDGAGHGLLAPQGLTPGGYHLLVARFEPENHVDLMVEGYVASGATLPLVVVGSAPYSDTYTRRVHGLADDRVRFLGGVWDQDLLDQLYAHAATYLHGHSVGGTNPSLLRAIGGGTATIAFDVSFNREVLRDHGVYVSTPAEVGAAVDEAEAHPELVTARGLGLLRRALDYDWDDVAGRYEALCASLPGRRAARRRGELAVPTGRRLGGGTARTEADRAAGLPLPVAAAVSTSAPTAATAVRATAPATVTPTATVAATATATAGTAADVTSGTTVDAASGTPSGLTVTDRPAGPRAGLVWGAFDVVDVADVRRVAEARAQSQRLVAGVLSDALVAGLTGRAPVVPAADRAAVVHGLRDVDEVVLLDRLAPTSWADEHGVDVVFDPADERLLALAEVPAPLRRPLAGTVTTAPGTAVVPRTGVVGYVPGAWDLFHVGHLTLLERARQACDHLVVGVGTDAYLARAKGAAPVVPFARRREIVAAMGTVDEVVADSSQDKALAWETVRFDVLFKGDDWQGTPKGDRLEAQLAAVGARLVYYPYTERTSSTALRARLFA